MSTWSMNCSFTPVSLITVSGVLHRGGRAVAVQTALPGRCLCCAWDFTQVCITRLVPGHIHQSADHTAGRYTLHLMYLAEAIANCSMVWNFLLLHELRTSQLPLNTSINFLSLFLKVHPTCMVFIQPQTVYSNSKSRPYLPDVFIQLLLTSHVLKHFVQFQAYVQAGFSSIQSAHGHQLASVQTVEVTLSYSFLGRATILNLTTCRNFCKCKIHRLHTHNLLWPYVYLVIRFVMYHFFLYKHQVPEISNDCLFIFIITALKKAGYNISS